MDGTSWAIKTIYGKHTQCGRLEENPNESFEWLVRHLIDEFYAILDYPTDSLQKLVRERFKMKANKG